MGGTEGHFHLPVVLRALIFVAHHHRDRCAEGHAIEQATENFDLVILLAGGGDLALAWLAAVEFGLDRFKIQLQPGRAAVDDYANPAAMGFAEGADPKEISEAAAH